MTFSVYRFPPPRLPHRQSLATTEPPPPHICATPDQRGNAPTQNWGERYPPKVLQRHLLRMADAHMDHCVPRPAAKLTLGNICEYQLRQAKPNKQALAATGLRKELVDRVTDMSRTQLNNMTQMAVAWQNLPAATQLINTVDSDGNHGLHAVIKAAKASPETPESCSNANHLVAAFAYLGGKPQAADPRGEHAEADRQYREAHNELTRQFELQNPGADARRDRNHQERIDALRDTYMKVATLYPQANVEATLPSGSGNWSGPSRYGLQTSVLLASDNRNKILNNIAPKGGW
ncbi:MAG: hypothetical protein JWP52_927 [Rhizobacter sp.]|nr:hypothetical protein [Rhizobacter sp.]